MKLKRPSRFTQNLMLYAFIAALSATQTYIASGDLPRWLAPPIGIVLAAAIAVKAKMSRDSDDQEKPNEETS